MLNRWVIETVSLLTSNLHSCSKNLLLTLQNVEMPIVRIAVPAVGTSRRRQFRFHVAQSRGFLGNLFSLPFLLPIKF